MIPLRYLSIFYALAGVLFVLTILKYPGQGHIYALFTIVSNALLHFGFRRKAIFSDAFIGVFFWLGFWFKLSVRVAFMDGQFHEPVGNFDGSGAAFDEALLVASCGLLGLVVVSVLREHFVFNYPQSITETADQGLLRFYRSYRKTILSIFAFFFAAVALTNAYFGIYQRGAIPQTVLPYGLSGVYKWLLLFGLASFSALILKFEFTLNKKTSYLVTVLGLTEGFLSNVSLLSRGMVLNTGALAYGVIRSLKIYAIKSSWRFAATAFLLFLVLFGSSVVLVNYLRLGDEERTVFVEKHLGSHKHKLFFIDRWVGIEGVMAVVSYPRRGWGLWNEAWKETLSYNEMSLYDRKLITSPYRNTDKTKYHHISLPGIVAFCFYPGSYLFLFACMLVVGVIAAAIEICVFKLGGGNVILCALLAQVVTYRFAHFGYVPRQSHLLFGALFLNVFLIYFANRFLLYLDRRKISH